MSEKVVPGMVNPRPVSAHPAVHDVRSWEAPKLECMAWMGAFLPRSARGVRWLGGEIQPDPLPVFLTAGRHGLYDPRR